LALAKAFLAFALIFLLGRRLLKPIFYFVAERRSAEIFTLTVLLVALLSAWVTNSLGLSLAFGAFLAGMILGETEFRHQVESTIRPFRDVLLGLFFIGIGMLFDPMAILSIWHWAILGAAILLITKTCLVAAMVKHTNVDWIVAWRTGLILAVGGEFGFALLAIAIAAGVLDAQLGQLALSSVLISMIAGPFVIRYSGTIAHWLVKSPTTEGIQSTIATPETETASHLKGHVIICGYGRIGQSVAHLLEEEGFSYVALDLDLQRVSKAHAAGEPVYYGDATNRDILELLGLARARLVVITYSEVAPAFKILEYLKYSYPKLRVMVRSRDEVDVKALQQAGATEVVPETLEAGLMIAAQSLILLDVPVARVSHRIQEQRASKYRLIQESYLGQSETKEKGD
jgi:CPA2 family monovalent cation:H+ antiporter-2